MTALIKVAIIDDDPSVRKALTRTLASAKYLSSAFGSVEDFLAILHEDNPQCIIADYQLPKMTGLDLHLRLRSRHLNVPVIIISAHDGAMIRQTCLDAGISSFLAKPFSREMLLRSIATALSSK